MENSEVKKLDMKSLDFYNENFEMISQMFPNVIVETLSLIHILMNGC